MCNYMAICSSELRCSRLASVITTQKHIIEFFYHVPPQKKERWEKKVNLVLDKSSNLCQSRAWNILLGELLRIMGFASAAVAKVASDGSSAEIVSLTSSGTKLPLCLSKGFQKSDPVSFVFQPGVTEGKVSWRKEVLCLPCKKRIKAANLLQRGRLAFAFHH